MKIRYRPFELALKYPFTISGFSRTATPLILLEIEHDGVTGYGEASMVPYMGESTATATDFLAKVKLKELKQPFDFDHLTDYLDSLAPGNPSVKAAIDIAMHDLLGKLEDKPCYAYFGSDPAQMPVTSVTIGIDTLDVVRRKAEEAAFAAVVKIKLDGTHDEELIRTIRSVTDAPIYGDANQGWKDVEWAVDHLHWLNGQGVVVVEQPMSKLDPDANAKITERSPIPILGDESVQRLPDVWKAEGVYHGINVKLMKSGGLHEACKMIHAARKLNMKVMIGCMSETSVATLAAAALAPLCDWADLDGPFLTKNNPFPDPLFLNGRWILNDEAGLGLKIKAESGKQKA